MGVRKLFTTVAALALAIGVVGCSASNDSPDAGNDEPIRLGALFPLTGPNAALGTETFQGALTAVEIFNERGGLDGRQVELVSADAPDPNAATSEANRLISREGVDVIIGTQSSALSIPASAVAERAGVIYWETVATSDEVTGRGFENIFRYNATGTMIGTTKADAVVDFIAPALGVEAESLRIGIVNEDSSYGKTVEDASAARAEELGLNVVVREEYNAASTRDFASLLLKLNEAQIDVMLSTMLVDDTLLFFRQASQTDFAPKAIIGTGGVGNPAFQATFGDKIQGVAVGDTPSSDALPDSVLTEESVELRTQYRERYTEAYGADQLSTNSDLGFSATWVLLNYVLPQSESLEPDAIRAAALEVDLPLGSGVTGYGAEYAPADAPNAGQNLRALVAITQWIDGELQAVYPAEIAVAEPELPLAPWGEN